MEAIRAGSLEDRERDKYTRMWRVQGYRSHSPGLQVAPRAAHWLGMQQGESIIDFGCGTGRAGQWFREQGLHVQLVDIVNALDPGIGLSFINACLWELPDKLTSTWGFCADVMEHIPRGKIETVIQQIAKTCKKGAFFQIATGPDSFGNMIGETLHVTIQSRDAWRDLLNQHFTCVRTEDIDRGLLYAGVHDED